MRRETYRIVGFGGLLLLWLLTGCRSTKEVGAVKLGEAQNPKEFFNSMHERAFQFNTLSARMNVDVELSGKLVSSRVDLKMIKDSAFQLSVQPFLGVELFRVEFTPDSVKVIDRMNKRYVAENYQQLKGETPIDFNFYNLQSLFTNRLFLPGEQTISAKHYNQFTLKQTGTLAQATSKDAMQLLYTFVVDGEQKLLSTQVTDASNRYALRWEYTDFRITDDQVFPMLMDVQVLTDNALAGGMKLSFSRIQKDIPLPLSFAIPPKYTRITFAVLVKGLTNRKQ